MSKRFAAIAVLTLIVSLGLIEPLAHCWIAYAPPDGLVPTGIRTSDGVIYAHCMNMFESGFYSPYATAAATDGPNSVHYFWLPFHWLYGIFGAFAGMLGLSHFFALGWINGFFLSLMLYVVWRFFREVDPDRANIAFVLYTLGGGLSGLIYLVAMQRMANGDVSLREFVARSTAYELLEGPGLLPSLYGPRAYYTVSLALSIGSLTALIRAVRIACGGHALFAALLLFAGGIVNARYAGLLACSGILYLLCAETSPARLRKRFGMYYAIALTLALAVNAACMANNPVGAANTAGLVRQSILLTPMLVALCWRLLLASRAWSGVLALPAFPRVAAYGALGYLAAFVPMHFAYQIYHGNLLTGGDGAAAVAVSDPALLGALLGAVWGYRTVIPSTQDEHAWLWPWLLVLLAVGVCAIGQGWFLRLVPQRALVVAALPLALLGARGFMRWQATSPRVAQTVFAMSVLGGVSAILLSAFAVHGPLKRDIQLWPRSEFVPQAVAEGMESVPPGIVLAPSPYNDLLSLYPGVRVLGGMGAADLSDAPSLALNAAVERFFAADTPDDARIEILRAWKIVHVFAPDPHVAVTSLARSGVLVPQSTNPAVYRVEIR